MLRRTIRVTDHDPKATSSQPADATPENKQTVEVKPLDTLETPAVSPASDKAALQLAAEVVAAQKAAQDYREGWQRERAEFANYKKRVEREMADLSQSAAADAFKSLLPALDDFELAMSNVPADLQSHAWLNGMGAVQRKFVKALSEAGITLIDPKGQPFDPSKHEAVAMEDSSEVESGHVTATLRKGYAFGERVLRTALVRVAN